VSAVICSCFGIRRFFSAEGSLMSLTPCRDLQIGRSFSHSLGGVRRGNVGPFLSLRVLSRGQHALSLRFCSPLLLDLTAFMQSTPRGRVSILNKLPWSVAFVLRVCSEGWISKPVPRPQPTRILYPDISLRHKPLVWMPVWTVSFATAPTLVRASLWRFVLLDTVVRFAVRTVLHSWL